jgi:hypothetical protein
VRSLAFASLIVIAALAACSAVDDFTRFKFVEDGGSRAHDDLAGSPLPGFGDSCSSACDSNLLHPLSCFQDFNGKTAPGGICTRQCSSAAACADLPDAVCVTVENIAVCLPRCDLFASKTCRSMYDCCANGKPAVAGACAPTDTSLCH